MELTRRELDVLKFLASGYTNEQTANILGVTYRTISVHLESIWRKLDVESRPATVTRADKPRALDQSPVRI
jgi:DNA-binding CsgD family transcriptional regulator